MGIFDPPAKQRSGSIFDAPQAPTAPPSQQPAQSPSSGYSFFSPQAAGDIARQVATGASGGASDYALALAKGEYAPGSGSFWSIFGPGVIPDAAKEQAATQEAAGRLGVVPTLAANALGYALGPGKVLGPLARMAGGAIATGRKASALAGLLEGATAGGGSSAIQGGTPGEIAANAALGGVGGALFGTMGKKTTPDMPDIGQPQSSSGPPTGMYADKQAAYQPLAAIPFDTHAAALNNAEAGIKALRNQTGFNVPLDIPDDVASIVKNLKNQPVVNGLNIQRAIQKLQDTRDWTGYRYADALSGVLKNDQPTFTRAPPGTPPPAGATLPPTGAGTIVSGDTAYVYRNGQIMGTAPRKGLADEAKQAGDAIAGRLNDLERLEPTPGNDQPTPAAIKQTMGFYPDQASPERQGLDALLSAQKPPFNWWLFRHPAGAAIGGGMAGIENMLPEDVRHNPWVTTPLHVGEAALLFGGLHSLAKPKPQSALDAARYAIATGRPSTPTVARNPLLDLFLGHMAAQPIGQ